MWWLVVVAVVALVVVIWAACDRPVMSRDQGEMERGRYNPHRKGE